MPSEPTARLCVYCGSNVGNSPAFVALAQQLGSALAHRGIGLVYGGGQVGLMGLVADAALAAGGEVIGVITEQLVGAEVAHTGLTRIEVTATMHERKARLSELADGFVVLPGGFGTLDELAEVLTWNQLGIIAKPVVLLDADGYWAPMFEWMERSVQAGFMRSSHRMLAQHAHSVDEAIAMATTPVPEIQHKWLDRDGTPAMGTPAIEEDPAVSPPRPG
ncbi:MAG: TIGR00730 family Rossman fold protein [Ilumatobacteraceae bacterium]